MRKPNTKWVICLLIMICKLTAHFHSELFHERQTYFFLFNCLNGSSKILNIDHSSFRSRFQGMTVMFERAIGFPMR